MTLVSDTQLEVIHPSGDISFFPLDPSRGVLNIGRHPDNDVVLSDGSLDLFHALIDVRQPPFQIILLADTYASGPSQTVGTAQTLNLWEPFPLGNYTLLLISESAQPPADFATGHAALLPDGPTRVTPLSVEPPVDAAAPTVPLPLAPIVAITPIVPLSREALIEREDDLILVDLDTDAWEIMVEQTARGELTVTNGGDLVATFEAKIEGLPPEWVLILPRDLNLNEGNRGKIEFDITPPRLPSSRAGLHRFAIVVTSPNYPGHVARLVASLTIQPFYEFAVGDIQPKQQTVGGRKPAGFAEFTVANRSNAPATFRLEGSDDEHATTIEFNAPVPEIAYPEPPQEAPERESDASDTDDDNVADSPWQAGNVQYVVAPNEIATIPLRITPLRPPYIALRPRSYAYTITAGILESPQFNRTVLAQIRAKPRIGPVTIFFILLILVASIVAIFLPRIDEFAITPTQIRAGESVTITGRGSPFTQLRLNGQPIEGSVFQQDDRPLETKTYELTGDSWLSRFFPVLNPSPAQVKVTVKTLRPTITRFGINGREVESVLVGQPVELSWEMEWGVDEETELIISENGTPLDSIPPDEQKLGKRSVEPAEGETVYTLTATNIYGSVSRSARVVVSVPTPTPVPSGTPIPSATPLPLPVIVAFSVEPAVVVQGEPVEINWVVNNVESITISGVPDALPSTGTNFRIVPNETTNFVLSATNGQQEVISAPQQVIVNPAPTGTVVPVAPVISAFSSTEEEVKYGEVIEIQLSWAVDGAFTDITISNPFLGEVKNLPAQGSIPVTVPAESTFYVLTATNRGETTSAQIRLSVIVPTATPTSTPSMTPTQTPTLTPTPTITPSPTWTPSPTLTETPTITPSPTLTPTTPPTLTPTLTPTITPSATPYPVPVVSYFTAAVPQGGDETALRQIGVQGNTLTYEAIAGTVVVLQWSIQGVDTVTITELGQRPPTNNETVPPLVEEKTYRIVGENPGGTADAYIKFIVIAPNPPIPGNFSGSIVQGESQLVTRLTWSYPATEEQNIAGFRIYRAIAPPGEEFNIIVDESVLEPEFRRYDDDEFTCGQAYYIVAVYYDPVTARYRETAPSNTSYYSPPCSLERPGKQYGVAPR